MIVPYHFGDISFSIWPSLSAQSLPSLHHFHHCFTGEGKEACPPFLELVGFVAESCPEVIEKISTETDVESRCKWVQIRRTVTLDRVWCCNRNLVPLLLTLGYFPIQTTFDVFVHFYFLRFPNLMCLHLQLTNPRQSLALLTYFFQYRNF